MLGLILGRSAGLTKAEPTLPRFLPARPAGFNSNFLVLVAELGDATALMDGLIVAEGKTDPDGVLRGPSFGVLRADNRGVDWSSWIAVSDLETPGRDAPAVDAAGSGRAKSSLMGCVLLWGMKEGVPELELGCDLF